MTPTHLSRRAFCIGASILGASIALGGCASKTDTAETGSTDEAATDPNADLIIIGAGLSGMACARSAAENGASVILIDKAPFAGSTFQTSMGNVSILQIADNEEFWQFQDGPEDTMNDFIARYTKATETGKVDAPYPDYDRVKALMAASCETIAWMEELGVDFQQSFTKEMVGTDTVKPDASNLSDTLPGAFVVEQMVHALDNLGVDLRLSTEALELITEGDAVVGVRVDDGAESELRAPVVVLATGGFGASEAYCDELVPTLNKIGFQYQGNAMNTGDGMTMAKAVDAALYEDCWVIPNVIVPARALTAVDPDFELLCDQSIHGKALEGGATATKLIVDATGERFINEALPPIALATTMADRDAAPYFALFDSSDGEVVAVLEKGVGTDGLLKADTIEALAETAQLPALPETFAAYQAAAESGADEAFGKTAEKLTAYASGPYYLVSYVPSYVATMGGVKTNADCQAVRADESAITGLYVVGECTHRFMYNRSFVRHCSNSSALTMGRLTGKALAELSA